MIYYTFEQNEQQEILVCEPRKDRRYLNKTETVFSQCNGYMGVRAAYELTQLEECRGTFLAGLFHRAGEREITEQINCPDVTAFRVFVDGVPFYPDEQQVCSFSRKLNAMTGELSTDILYQTPMHGKVRVQSRRFASLSQRELFCHELVLTFEHQLPVTIETGIDGRITNSGVSHFCSTQAQLLEGHTLSGRYSSDDAQRLQVFSRCEVDFTTTHSPQAHLEKRSIYQRWQTVAIPGQPLKLQKYTLYTHRPDAAQAELEQTLAEAAAAGYAALYAQHRVCWNDYWKLARMDISGATPEEDGAIVFAQYHLRGMVPADSPASSVGAKGLTGEGYKGHVFWDTELFVMPYFTSLFPQISRNLLQYRYDRLEGARKKARENGYEGALFPWESAVSGEEETPRFAAINIHTGKATPVWSGIKEHHVTADIAFAARDYYRITGDQAFWEQCGQELVLETAKFWCSRAVWQQSRQRYEILDVIGPDEYTEHVDNNAYTNYLAHENVAMAVQILRESQQQAAALCREQGWEKRFLDFLKKLYLPQPNQDGILPQDDTFLQKLELPTIETYRQSKHKQAILRDFSRDEVVDLQVLKQADLVMLLNLMPNRFSPEIVAKNVRYYEARTVHDSSLSYCAHACACAQIGEVSLADAFFQKALEVDLDDNETDSRDGVHAAALGGILNSLLEGFAGVRAIETGLVATPHLPARWKKMTFLRRVQGILYRICIEGDKATIEKEETA